MKKLACLLVALAACASGATAQVKLVPLTTFGPHGDGTLLPGDVPFLTSDGNRYQRGMAYNPATGHLIIVNRNPIGAETINVIDALTGANVSELDQSSRALGGSANYIYNQIAIAPDGAIYVGNLSTSGSAVQFNLYRWADENSLQTLVYFGNPGNTTVGGSRWGDTLTVRGAGMGTELLLATQNGTLAAILRPSIADFSAFTNAPLNAAVPSGGLGYGIAFGNGDTFYGKAASAGGNPLYLMSYDVNAGNAVPSNTYGLTAFPGTAGPLATHMSSNWLACISDMNSTVPHKLRLLDISNTAQPPVLIDRLSVATFTNANAVYAGSLAFGFETNLYVLDSDNGIAAFTITNGIDELPPSIFGQPQSSTIQITSNALFSVGVEGTLPMSYQWVFNATNALANATNATLSLTNAGTNNGGSYSLVITNAYGAITSAVVTLTVLPNFGNLLVYDPFDYAVGSVLPGQGGWTSTSTGTNGAIDADNLTCAGLATSVGNHYLWTNSSSVRVPFGQYSAGEVYCSFLFRIDSTVTGTASETTAGFSYGTTTTFPLKINILGNGAGGYQIGLYKGAGTTGNGTLDTTHNFAPGETVFVVARYGFHAGVNADTCDLWLNPDPATFGAATPPAATIANVGAGTSQSSWSYIDRFFWRWVSAGYVRRVADELRVGFSWAGVTPPAPPSLAAQLSGGQVIVSWSTNQSTGFVLQSNPSVEDSGGWEPVGTPVVIQGARNTVTVSSSGRLYFRLKK